MLGTVAAAVCGVEVRRPPAIPSVLMQLHLCTHASPRPYLRRPHPSPLSHPPRRKETHCEFCDARLPDWKGTLTPQCGANAPAVMNVNFDGRTYSFEVKPGPDGYRQFTEAIRRAFNLPDDSELNITFTCDEPTTGGAGLGQRCWGVHLQAASRAPML